VCYQECALYGELVLWLRDQAAELLAPDPDGVKAARERLGGLIRDWFFAPQKELHGCAPRDLIYAEQLGRPNPIHPEHIDDFFDDDCPICQAEREKIKSALETGADHGWHWHHDDGGFPLIAHYDPEGWDARWAEEDAEFEAWREAQAAPAAPDYEAPPLESQQVDPQTFMEILQHPWMDPALHQAAQKLAAHCDVPIPDARVGLRYRRVTHKEAASLASGLSQQGVDVEALLAQIDAWPYQNVALDWLSQPEQNVTMLCQAMEQEQDSDAQEAPSDARTRYRQHRDFILALSGVMPLAARLWLQGWLEGIAQGGWDPEGIPF
jgi:hypothetical protein